MLSDWTRRLFQYWSNDVDRRKKQKIMVAGYVIRFYGTVHSFVRVKYGIGCRTEALPIHVELELKDILSYILSYTSEKSTGKQLTYTSP